MRGGRCSGRERGRDGVAAGTATDGGEWFRRTHLGTSSPHLITQRAAAIQTSPRVQDVTDSASTDVCVDSTNSDVVHACDIDKQTATETGAALCVCWNLNLSCHRNTTATDDQTLEIKSCQWCVSSGGGESGCAVQSSALKNQKPYSY